MVIKTGHVKKLRSTKLDRLELGLFFHTGSSPTPIQLTLRQKMLRSPRGLGHGETLFLFKYGMVPSPSYAKMYGDIPL